MMVFQKKRLFKQGVSPLIATVLIISFTVIIAVVIFTWLHRFTEEVKEETGTINIQLKCAKDVSVGIMQACYTNDGRISLTVENKANTKIESFKVRLYKSATEVKTDVALPELGGLGIYTQFIDWDKGVKKIEVIPLIKVNDQVVGCPANKDLFGSLTANPIPNCQG